jgi:hypothetical protein
MKVLDSWGDAAPGDGRTPEMPRDRVENTPLELFAQLTLIFEPFVRFRGNPATESRIKRRATRKTRTKNRYPFYPFSRIWRISRLKLFQPFAFRFPLSAFLAVYFVVPTILPIDFRQIAFLFCAFCAFLR